MVVARVGKSYYYSYFYKYDKNVHGVDAVYGW